MVAEHQLSKQWVQFSQTFSIYFADSFGFKNEMQPCVVTSG